MTSNQNQFRRSSDSKGFTIVEVMIVLAIAGLILLIVFEAIPALTRGSRNNQRKQDATAILQTISQYQLNNSGNFPSSCGAGFASTCKTASNTSVLYYAKLTYYDATTNNVTIHAQTETSAAPLAAASSTNSVDIYNYEKCVDGVQDTATNTGADYNSIIAMFGVESGSGGITGQCQQL
jgi:prepilin-type N-terminal cleavage/methylation domain-containing protein